MESQISLCYKILGRKSEELTVFFDFPVEIRKIIYTTNLIENLNGKSESTPKQIIISKRMMPFF
jgi:transposase-like protein